MTGLPQSTIAESQVRKSSNLASSHEALPTRRSCGVMSQLSSASMPFIVERAALLVTSCCCPLGRRSTAETCISLYFIRKAATLNAMRRLNASDLKPIS